MKVGVIGGTFDPVHYGHLILADQMAGYLNLSKVLFVPSNIPPHKDTRKISPVVHRVEMIRLAIEDNCAFEISTVECEREGMSYSYETFDILSGMYDEGTEFFFIVGSDVLNDLLSFRRFDDLSKRCSFATAVRPGADISDLNDMAERLYVAFGARVCIAPFQEIGISSTIIREKLRSGVSVRYMLPGSVARYIEANGLYRQGCP